MPFTRFLALSIAVLLSVGPSATASTVHDLAKYCSSTIDNSDYSYCLGVMAGLKTWLLSPPPTNCSDNRARIRFLFLIILKRASRSPTRGWPSWRSMETYLGCLPIHTRTNRSWRCAIGAIELAIPLNRVHFHPDLLRSIFASAIQSLT
jgi:hypothetical protein